MFVSKSNRRILFGVFSLAATLMGCADQQESIIISRAIAWGGDEEDAECLVDTANATLSATQLDVFWQTEAVVGLEIINQLAAQGAASENNGIDNSEVRIVEADISLRLPQAPQVIDALRAINPALVDFTEELSTTSLPGNTIAPISVTPISQPASAALNQQLGSFATGTRLTMIADIVVQAERTGNTAGNIGVITARSFSHPIEICSGCNTFFCPVCGPSNCPSTAFVGGICGNAQDFGIVPRDCIAPE